MSIGPLQPRRIGGEVVNGERLRGSQCELLVTVANDDLGDAKEVGLEVPFLCVAELDDMVMRWLFVEIETKQRKGTFTDLVFLVLLS